MAEIDSIHNQQSQSIDTLVRSDGEKKYKRAVGGVNAGFDSETADQGIATHVDGDDFDAVQASVVVGAGVMDDGNVMRFLVDAVGRLISRASAGVSIFRLVAAGTTEDANTIKASPGLLHSVDATNTNAAVRYLKLYNKASNPAVASDTPKFTITLEPGKTTHLTWPAGVDFGTGIAMVLVTGHGDTDATEVSAGEHIIEVTYE